MLSFSCSRRFSGQMRILSEKKSDYRHRKTRGVPLKNPPGFVVCGITMEEFLANERLVDLLPPR